MIIAELTTMGGVKIDFTRLNGKCRVEAQEGMLGSNTVILTRKIGQLLGSVYTIFLHKDKFI